MLPSKLWNPRNNNTYKTTFLGHNICNNTSFSATPHSATIHAFLQNAKLVFKNTSSFSKPQAFLQQYKLFCNKQVFLQQYIFPTLQAFLQTYKLFCKITSFSSNTPASLHKIQAFLQTYIFFAKQ